MKFIYVIPVVSVFASSFSLSLSEDEEQRRLRKFRLSFNDAMTAVDVRCFSFTSLKKRVTSGRKFCRRTFNMAAKSVLCRFSSPKRAIFQVS